jgi:hypothetical protein
MKTKTLILISVVAGLAFASCQRSEPLEESSVEAADDAVVSEALYDDVFASLEIATVLAENTLKSATVIDTCPLVEVTFPGTGLWPRNVTIDYGESCIGLNDVERSGKIIIAMSAARRTEGSVRTVTFDNYTVNGAKIEGTYAVENLGVNGSSNTVFSVSLSGGKITFPDERMITRTFLREREYTEGYGTLTPWDDKCLITGYATGTNLNGVAYTHTIKSALEWQAACRFIVSGSIEFDIDGVEPFTLDYGEGECDAIATLSRGDETKEIILRFRHPKYVAGK